jgi:hypothetical protein
MRNESIELLNIAKELREYVVSLNLPQDVNEEGKPIGITLRISNTVRVHYHPLHDYCSMEFSNWPKTVNISLFETAGYSNNTITINVETVDDVELEAIILLVQADIAIFKAEKLIQDVHSSQVSL